MFIIGIYDRWYIQIRTRQRVIYDCGGDFARSGAA
jgi:hypothetical protein